MLREFQEQVLPRLQEIQIKIRRLAILPSCTEELVQDMTRAGRLVRTLNTDLRQRMRVKYELVSARRELASSLQSGHQGASALRDCLNMGGASYDLLVRGELIAHICTLPGMHWNDACVYLAKVNEFGKLHVLISGHSITGARPKDRGSNSKRFVTQKEVEPHAARLARDYILKSGTMKEDA